MSRTDAQRQAERRYESAGQRPGTQITIRFTDEQLTNLRALQRRGESLAAAIKRLLFSQPRIKK